MILKKYQLHSKDFDLQEYIIFIESRRLNKK